MTFFETGVELFDGFDTCMEEGRFLNPGYEYYVYLGPSKKEDPSFMFVVDGDDTIHEGERHVAMAAMAVNYLLDS